MIFKPNLLFYCQHSLGMGHLIRSFSLARTLAEDFNVIFLNGGRIPAGIEPPAKIRVVQLPALSMHTDKKLVSHDERYTPEQAKIIRRETILDIFSTYAPRVILIELFPFGRKKFADEIVPLLERARGLTHRNPVILCSLRDILVRSRVDQQKHDDRACALLNDYFDGVLVHADPSFAQLQDTFQPGFRLRVPVHYTGFVLPNRAKSSNAAREKRILVSAGGGGVGALLFRTAVEAHRDLWEIDRLPMTIVAGPFLPMSDFRELQAMVATLHGLELHRSVPDLTRLMSRVTGSISQCGYNTVMDLLHTAVPALVVPFSTAFEDEQTNRACRLKQLGLVRVLAPEQLNRTALIAEIQALSNFRPKMANLNVNGAHYTARLIAQLTARRQPYAATAKSGDRRFGFRP